MSRPRMPKMELFEDRSVETVEISGIIVTRTPDAVFLLFDGDREPEWIPESQIVDEKNQFDGTVMLTVPEWLAVKNGLL